jgi:diguanylate cyclase (GGDEF)-like protein
MAVLLIDLDDFKVVNDTHGHSVGDQLLMALALRLTGSVRETDTVARFGGDEFVIVLENLHNADEAVQVAEKVLQEIMRPVDLPMGPIQSAASVGIACFPHDADDVEQLLKRADQAMYAAKSSGSNHWRRAA